MFANLLAAPFVFAALAFLYLAWKVDAKYAVGMVPFVLISALIYVFSPQINWWRYRRKPPALPAALRDLLERYFPFYQRLPEAERQRFRDRVVLFRMGTDWMPMGWPEETLPADVQLALSAQAVMLTFHKPVFLFPKFEQVIVYPAPFPTPEYPFPHAAELYAEDGCLIFSAEQLMPAFLQPGRRYNIGLHEYAHAFVLSYPGEPYPDFDSDDAWQKLEQAGGFSRMQIEAAIGIADVPATAVAIHHYFTFPEQFRAILPAEAEALDKVFGA